MNTEFRDLGGKTPSANFVVLALALAALAFQSKADIYTLSAANTTAHINSIGSASNPAGWYDWSVNGVDQMDQHWFYYRVDNGTSGWIDSLGTPTLNASTATSLDLTYANALYSARVTYTLTPGTPGTGNSKMNQSVVFKSVTGAPISVHLYDYSHFTLGGVGYGQSVQRYGTTVTTFVQTMGSLVASNRVSVGASSISAVEAALFDDTRLSLTNGVPLNGVSSIGPDDVTFTLQIDRTISGTTTMTVSELLTLTVPEPSSLALVVVGLLGWAAQARKRW